MFDLKLIREDPQAFDTALGKRGHEPVAEKLLALDQVRREKIALLQDAQGRRNDASKQIGAAKASGDEDRARGLIEEIADLKSAIQEGEEEERRLDEELATILSQIPNLPLDDVPLGEDEAANVETHKHGAVPTFDFEPRQHFEIGEDLGQMGFRNSGQTVGRPFCRSERSIGAHGTGDSCFHDRPSHPGTWLPGRVAAVSRARSCHVWHRAVAEVC